MYSILRHDTCKFNNDCDTSIIHNVLCKKYLINNMGLSVNMIFYIHVHASDINFWYYTI